GMTLIRTPVISRPASALAPTVTAAAVPVVSRASLYARADSVTPATGIYAFVAPGMDAGTWIVDVRDTTDLQIAFDRRHSASAAIATAVQLGATFIVDEF